MEIILHIGRHKSGTSSLQEFLRNKEALLGDRGVLYPKSGRFRSVAHHDLAKACNPRIGSRDSALEIARNIRDELRPHHDKIILSSEAFQNVREVSTLKEVLEEIAPRSTVQVVCYVREHVDYAVSSLKQMIQNQTRFASLSDHTSAFKDPTKFLNLWRSVGDLSLRWYHRSLLKDGDIIADFADQVGLGIAAEQLSDMNPSIGGNLLICKMAMNRLDVQGLQYGRARDLATEERRYRQEFFIDDAAVARARANSRYNPVFFRELGEPPLRSWAQFQAFPDVDNLREDIARILGGLALDEDAIAREAAQSASWLTL